MSNSNKKSKAWLLIVALLALLVVIFVGLTRESHDVDPDFSERRAISEAWLDVLAAEHPDWDSNSYRASIEDFDYSIVPARDNDDGDTLMLRAYTGGNQMLAIGPDDFSDYDIDQVMISSDFCFSNNKIRAIALMFDDGSISVMDNAFSNCDNLAYVQIGNGSRLYADGNSFSNCASFTSIETANGIFPKRVTRFDNAFYNTVENVNYFDEALHSGNGRTYLAEHSRAALGEAFVLSNEMTAAQASLESALAAYEETYTASHFETVAPETQAPSSGSGGYATGTSPSGYGNINIDHSWRQYYDCLYGVDPNDYDYEDDFLSARATARRELGYGNY